MPERFGPFVQGRDPTQTKLVPHASFAPEFFQTANSIYNNAKTYADSAIAELNRRVNELVAWALHQFNIPIPDMLNDPIDFWDWAKDKLESILGSMPAQPSVSGLTEEPPTAPMVDIPIPETIEIEDIDFSLAELDEDALWNRARDRELIKLNTLIEDARRDFAATGFTAPSGTLNAAIEKARLGYQMILSDFNRDIPLKALEFYKARADVYRTMMDGKKAALEAIQLQFKALIEQVQAQLSVFEGQMKVWLARADMVKTNNQIQTDIYKAIMQGWGAEVDAIVKSGGMAITASELQYRAQLQAVQTNVEIAKLQLQEIIEQVKLQLAGATSSAEIYRSIAAAALSAMHMSASVSSGQSYSEGYNLSTSLQHQLSDSYNESQSNVGT